MPPGQRSAARRMANPRSQNDDGRRVSRRPRSHRTQSEGIARQSVNYEHQSNRSITMANDIQTAVKTKYGEIATSGLSSAHGGVRAVAEAFGYSEAELASIPAEANMGLS